MTGVLCVGEPLVSLTPVNGTLEVTDRLHVATAGAELNVAIHLGRLGLPVRFAGRVGADPLGARVRATLAKAGVDTDFLEDDPVRPTGLYLKDARAGGTVMHYYRSGSAGSAYDALPSAALEGLSQVHVTGVTAALSAGWRGIIEGLAEYHPHVSFDVNYRPALWSTAQAGPVLLAIARRAETVFVGLDEAEALWGCTTPEEVRRLLPEPTRLVVKNGPDPVVAFAGDMVVAQPVPHVDVVEPVGAGDAFAAGYLAAVEGGDDTRTAVRWGNAVAASVLRDLGDHESTPPRRTLQAMTTDEGAANGPHGH